MLRHVVPRNDTSCFQFFVPALQPTTPIQFLKGVGPHLAQLFAKKSVYTAWDLLFFLPLKYIDRRKLAHIDGLEVGTKQCFIAEIKSMHSRVIRNKRKMLEMLVSDGQSNAIVTFFQFNEGYLRKRFPEGSRVLFFGDVRLYKGLKSVVHPEMELWDDDHDDDESAQLKIYPFYSLTEGLYQKTVRHVISKNLNELLTIVSEDPRSVRDSGKVNLSLAEAFKYVHEPPLTGDIDELNNQTSVYHQRLIYDEFFFLQLGLVSKRYKMSKRDSYKIINEQTLFHKALKTLPFELTGDQKSSIEDIKNDFSLGRPMNRMIQGDVGSGKTIVAFLSALLAIESGYQVALMAPTEILAEQHFKNLFPYEEKIGVRIELLTGSTPNKRRERILFDLEQGNVNLIIGTHALITSDVVFYHLGYVIIDEQHRFGVMQRSQLKNKSKMVQGEIVPHLLVMSATPIPRSLSMCIYGDVDLSVIKELPKGRKPIVTRVYREKQRVSMYGFIEKQILQGRQAYFVYPLVEESEKMDLKDATEMHRQLTERFTDFKVGLLHGRMKSDEKELVMALFKENKIQLLVSTTVVEVGVDVPNSTVMVIEHAERFGLSQLHQLRGRVGRGAAESYCFLVASYAQSEESRHRLKIMEETGDGFVIAEEDLKLRGPGEFLGTKQSGMPDFRLAQLVRDGKLLAAAKKRAEEILAKDPDLLDPQNATLKKIMIERWGTRLDLSLV